VENSPQNGRGSTDILYSVAGQLVDESSHTLVVRLQYLSRVSSLLFQPYMTAHSDDSLPRRITMDRNDSYSNTVQHTIPYANFTAHSGHTVYTGVLSTKTKEYTPYTTLLNSTINWSKLNINNDEIVRRLLHDDMRLTCIIPGPSCQSYICG